MMEVERGNKGQNYAKYNEESDVLHTEEAFAQYDQTLNKDSLEEKTVIWGTTLAVDDVMQQIRNFFLNFRLKNDQKAFYPPLLAQIRETQNFLVNIDAAVSPFSFSSKYQIEQHSSIKLLTIEE